MAGSTSSEARAFVDSLRDEALAHAVCSHPYLRALAEGDVPDVDAAIADFARHYAGYSTSFPRFLTAAMSRLEEPAHRAALLDNLTEESGTYEEDEIETLAEAGIEAAWYEGLPHPALFRRFAAAAGAEAGAPVADEVVAWRELLLSQLARCTPACAVGILGLGTETIVATMYTHLIEAIERAGTLHPRDYVFFPLHTLVDEHHQQVLLDVAAELCVDEAARRELRQGMLMALSLRSSFFDWMLARARAMAPAPEAA